MKNKPILQEIAITHLQRGQYQPRREFDPTALQELAESIKSSGLIQPIVIRSLTPNRFEIIAGERRWRAAQMAGLNTVTCLVREISDEQAAAVTTIENIQRENLNPIEEAQAYARLVSEFGYHHDEVAAIMSKSRVKITNSLRLLKLTQPVQQLLIDKQLSESHGKVLASVAHALQYELAQQCIAQGWSVRQLEAETKNELNQTKIKSLPEDPNITRLEQAASDQFGAPVKLETDLDKKSGWLKIRYFDPDTLAGLLDKIGVEYE